MTQRFKHHLYVGVIVFVSFCLPFGGPQSAAAAPKSKGVSSGGVCHASYNKRRNNCTILPSQCGEGFVPIAHPPQCHCECMPGPAKKKQ